MECFFEKEGRLEGITIVVKNMLNQGMSEKDILLFTECSKELLEEVKLQNKM